MGGAVLGTAACLHGEGITPPRVPRERRLSASVNMYQNVNNEPLPNLVKEVILPERAVGAVTLLLFSLPLPGVSKGEQEEKRIQQPGSYFLFHPSL